ncbi:MAG: VF530 family protein [Desulforhopalus sp.]
MNEHQAQPPPPKDPLHGLTLENILNILVADFGWEKLGKYIKIRCFTSNPSIPSSLKFLRKTPWAREKVEKLYLASQKRARKGK